MSEDDSNTGRNIALIAVVVLVGLVVLAVVAVVLFAVIGAFVLDVGSETGGPDASFTFSEADGELVISYEERSDSIDPRKLVVSVNGQDTGSWQEFESTHDDDRTIRIGYEAGDTVTIRHHDADGESTLATYGT